MKIVSITSKSAKLCVSLLTGLKSGKTGIAFLTLMTFTFTEKKRSLNGLLSEYKRSEMAIL